MKSVHVVEVCKFKILMVSSYLKERDDFSASCCNDEHVLGVAQDGIVEEDEEEHRA